MGSAGGGSVRSKTPADIPVSVSMSAKGVAAVIEGRFSSLTASSGYSIAKAGCACEIIGGDVSPLMLAKGLSCLAAVVNGTPAMRLVVLVLVIGVEKIAVAMTSALGASNRSKIS